jgi:biotin synthase
MTFDFQEVMAKLQHVASSREACDELCEAADHVRAAHLGDTVYLRGIIEFSNICRNQCAYCGIRCANTQVKRYRMPVDEIVETACLGKAMGCGTVVLQSGEDPFYTVPLLSEMIERIKAETGMAVTLSIGVRPWEELSALKSAGCDRYLLRFETSNASIFNAIHPDEPFARRIQCLTDLRELGYQVGSGFMIGIPPLLSGETPQDRMGATLEQIARDVLFTTQLKLQMIGCGPFLSHPDTPLAENPALENHDIYYATMALLRILNPRAHIPATTAFDALDPSGRNRVMHGGANIFMPNITPAIYRRQYQLYPNKPSIDDDPEVSVRRVCERLASLGRPVSAAPGHSSVK